ncbi:hypothetical protein STAWA0001_0329, partial [Staphylococcus warneri L37603]
MAVLGLEELEALAGELEDVLRVQVLHQRRAAVDAEGDRAAVGAGQLRVHGGVRAGDERGD